MPMLRSQPAYCQCKTYSQNTKRPQRIDTRKIKEHKIEENLQQKILTILVDPCREVLRVSENKKEVWMNDYTAYDGATKTVQEP